jgi:putative transposase
MTVTSNLAAFVPLTVNGRISQVYQPVLQQAAGRVASREWCRNQQRLIRLTNKRNRKVKHILHLASRRVIDHLVANRIGTLVIGYNQEWKQRVNIGRVNNQKFVAIPHADLVQCSPTRRIWRVFRWCYRKRATPANAAFLDGEFPMKRVPLCWKANQRGLVSSGDWLVDQCGCQWCVQHNCESISQRIC